MCAIGWGHGFTTLSFLWLFSFHKAECIAHDVNIAQKWKLCSVFEDDKALVFLLNGIRFSNRVSHAVLKGSRLFYINIIAHFWLVAQHTAKPELLFREVECFLSKSYIFLMFSLFGLRMITKISYMFLHFWFNIDYYYCRCHIIDILYGFYFGFHISFFCYNKEQFIRKNSTARLTYRENRVKCIHFYGKTVSCAVSYLDKRMKALICLYLLALLASHRSAYQISSVMSH